MEVATYYIVPYILPTGLLIIGSVLLTVCFFYVRYRQRLHKKGILDFSHDGLQDRKKEFSIVITYGRNRVKRIK